MVEDHEDETAVTRIFVVSTTCYDYDVMGYFSTEEKAREYMKSKGGPMWFLWSEPVDAEENDRVMIVEPY